MGRRYDVFISYNRATGEHRVRLLKDWLEREGYSIWMDEDIKPSTDFQLKIEEALDSSACVVVVWTKGAKASKWVRAEATKGDDGDRLISVRLDPDVDVPLPFNIQNVVDLTDWSATREASPELSRLLQAINAFVGQEQPETSPRPEPQDGFTARLKKGIVEGVLAELGKKKDEEETSLPREEQLRGILPETVWERLTLANALIDQMSRDSLSQAAKLARSLVDNANGPLDAGLGFDDGQIALLRSHYLSVLLGGRPGFDERSADGGLAAALSTGDPQQVDAALAERMDEPDDQSLFLFALYVLFPAGDFGLGKEFLRAASSVNPSSAEIKFHLARACARPSSPKRDSCLRGLRDTLRMSPNAELVLIYQTLLLLRSGKFETARANVEVRGGVLAPPVGAILAELVAERSVGRARARMFETQLDAALNTLRLPARPIAEVFASPPAQGLDPLSLPESWLRDLARRAARYLRSVTSRDSGHR